MPSAAPLWLQRIPSDVRRRLELAEAAAREGVAETHAGQAIDLVAILAPRMPFDEAVERYIEVMGLQGDEAEIVHTRALALLSEPDLGDDLARERPRGWGFNWRYATPLGALRYIRRKMRRSAEEDLWMELAAARAEEALVQTHLDHALVFVDLLEEHTAPPGAVNHYLDRMEVPAARARTAYQRVLATLADTLLPRLLEEDRRGPEPPAP